MATVERNQELNGLLVDVYRSLLQYAVEAWPWTAADAEVGLAAVRELAARQAGHAADIVDLLASRNWVVDFGIYPTDYTDLHYVALSYFLRLLEASQQELVAEIEQTLERCRDDERAAHAVSRLLESQRDIVKSLKELRQQAPSGV